MALAKEFVLEILNYLPDDCTIDDIQYELYVRHAIKEGERAADEGRLIAHDQVMREMKKWLVK